jgi:hypothetical protein
MNLQLDENAFRILQFRYPRKDHEGLAVEPSGEGFHPVANHVASTKAHLDPTTGEEGERPSPVD